MNVCLRNSKKEDYFEIQLNTLKNEYEELNIYYHYGNGPLNLENIDVLISGIISETELETANQLKVIIFPYTGVNYLPLKSIANRGITVVNSHGHAPVVALRAFTLGLALLGRVVELHNEMKQGKWTGIDNTSSWYSFLNMRCGMIGMGEIGLNLVKYLEPFNAKIVTLKRYEKRCVGLNDVTYYSTISEVCENSDIVFVSLPLTKDTKNIIDSSILENMAGKYIVNVGRGDLIKEDDLYHALENHVLSGAALDVWYQYPQNKESIYPSTFPFHELDNVLLSPHCAGNADVTRNLVIDEIIMNIRLYLKENKLKNIVSITKEY